MLSSGCTDAFDLPLEGLAAHAVECPPGQGLSNFWFNEHGCRGTGWGYNYTCSALQGGIATPAIRHTACAGLRSGNLVSLEHHPVTCKLGEVLAGFELRLDCPAGSFRIRYQCAAAVLASAAPEQHTECNDFEKRLQFLDQHAVACTAGQVMMGFSATKDQCEEAGQMRFDALCR